MADQFTTRTVLFGRRMQCPVSRLPQLTIQCFKYFVRLLERCIMAPFVSRLIIDLLIVAFSEIITKTRDDRADFSWNTVPTRLQSARSAEDSYEQRRDQQEAAPLSISHFPLLIFHWFRATR